MSRKGEQEEQEEGSSLTRTVSFKDQEGDNLLLFVYDTHEFMFFIGNMYDTNMNYTVYELICTDLEGNIKGISLIYFSRSEGILRIYSGNVNISEPDFRIFKGYDYIQTTTLYPKLSNAIYEALGFNKSASGLYHTRQQQRFIFPMKINRKTVKVSSLRQIPGLFEEYGVNPVVDQLIGPVTQHLDEKIQPLVNEQTQHLIQRYISSEFAKNRMITNTPFSEFFDPDSQTIFNESNENIVLRNVNAQYPTKSEPEYIGKHYISFGKSMLILTYKVEFQPSMGGQSIDLFFTVAQFGERLYCNVTLITPHNVPINELGLPSQYIPSILAFKLFDYAAQAMKIVDGEEVSITGPRIEGEYVFIGDDRNLEISRFFDKFGLHRQETIISTYRELLEENEFKKNPTKPTKSTKLKHKLQKGGKRKTKKRKSRHTKKRRSHTKKRQRKSRL